MAELLYCTYVDTDTDKIYFQSYNLSNFSGNGQVEVATDSDCSVLPYGGIDIALHNSELYIAWESDQELKFAKSPDAGATWSVSTITTISATEYVSNVRIEVASDGRIVVGWSIDEGWPTYHVKCSYSTDSGLNWSTTAVYSPTSEAPSTDLIIDSADNIYMFGHHSAGLYCFKSTDGAATFGAGVEVQAGLGASDAWSYRFDGTVDTSDNLYLVKWAEDLTDGWGNWRIVCWKSTDGNGSWSGPYTVAAQAAPATTNNLRIYTNGGSIMYVLWSDAYTWFSNDSTDGQTWDAAVTVSTEPGAWGSNYWLAGHVGGLDASSDIYFVFKDDKVLKGCKAASGATSWGSSTALYTGAKIGIQMAAIIGELIRKGVTYFFLA